MAETKTSDDEFAKMMKSYSQLDQLNKSQEEFRNQVKETKNLEATLKDITGDEVKLVDKNSEESKKAEAFKAVYDVHKKRTAEFLRTGLAGIVSSADSEAVIETATRTIKHNAKHEKYSAIAKLFIEYQTIVNASTPAGEQTGVTEQQAAEYQAKLKELVPTAIARKLAPNMKSYTPDEIKAYATFISFISGSYANQAVKDHFEYLKTELKAKKEEVQSYIVDSVKEDKDLIQFGSALYSISEQIKAKKEKDKKK